MAEERDRHEIEIERTEAGRKGGEAQTFGVAPAVRADTISWSAAIWAGIIAGLVFLILEMILVPLFAAGSPWGPPRMIAAILLGREVLPPPATFELGMFMGAALVHFILSVVYALILAGFIARVGMGTALGVGALFGLILYLINFYVFTGLFPWFAEARNWITLFSHVVFGLVAAWAYKALAPTVPLAAPRAL